MPHDVHIAGQVSEGHGVSGASLVVSGEEVAGPSWGPQGAGHMLASAADWGTRRRNGRDAGGGDLIEPP